MRYRRSKLWRRTSPWPLEGPAPELVESGFYLENADAPLLHAGLNQADLAHVLDLLSRGVMPAGAAQRLLGLLLEADRTRPDEFPYDHRRD